MHSASEFMSIPEFLAAGQLRQAVRFQQQLVEESAGDSAARLRLAELHALAGYPKRARKELFQIESVDPDWPASRDQFYQNFLAIYRREKPSRPVIFGEVSQTRHARCRWRAWQQAIEGNLTAARQLIDLADSLSPAVSGHIDGAEFDGLRDTDDIFGSVFELLFQGNSLWLPFEYVRSIRLLPAEGILDAVYRPVEVKLAEGGNLIGIIPVVYPGSARRSDLYALGWESDWNDETGITQGIGGRTFMAGDSEFTLNECRQIDITMAE